jgi:hypothetical protein
LNVADLKAPKNAMLRIANILAVVLALMAHPASAVGSAANAAEIVKRLADAYYAGRLSVDSAADLFRGSCENRSEGDYWVMDCIQVRSAAGRAWAEARRKRPGSALF